MLEHEIKEVSQNTVQNNNQKIEKERKLKNNSRLSTFQKGVPETMLKAGQNDEEIYQKCFSKKDIFFRD